MSICKSIKPILPQPKILSCSAAEDVKKILHDANLSDDALVKISRQLDFWCTEGLDDGKLLKLCRQLVSSTAVSGSVQGTETNFQCPKVRYGKTEVMVPIITTGGMRIQWSWLPDFLPIGPSKKKLVASNSQEYLKIVIRRCMKLGLNHFETARFYGTSEFQFAAALREMMDAGEFKREDFIFQTKVPAAPTKAEFLKRWNESWAHVGERLGHIDLFSIHCSSSPKDFKYIFENGDENIIDCVKELKKEGKIRHIGFSSHGTGETITKLIDTEEFEFVNLHYHHFGSYHAEGTINPYGGHGNAGSVKRALELDMGVFNISPVDKGGMLYKPTAAMARAIGPDLTPIAFGLHKTWGNGFHTASVGFGRPTDLDEAVAAASLYNDEETMKEVLAATERLEKLAREKLGDEWYEKGLLNIPSCFAKETDGTAIGHILWLHNLITAYGMYDFSKERYKNIEEARAKLWKSNKSFEEIVSTFSEGNIGFNYDPKFDLSEALKNHYNPTLAMKKITECQSWLSKTTEFAEDKLKSNEWDEAYDLRTWDIFPGESPSVSDVLLQNLTLGYLRQSKGSKDEVWINIVQQTRAAYGIATE